MRPTSMDEINGAGLRTWNENKDSLFPNGCNDYVRQVWLIAFKQGILWENERHMGGKEDGG